MHALRGGTQPLNRTALGGGGMGSLQRALEQLRSLATQIPLVKSVYPVSEPSFGDPAGTKEIESIQRALGAPLPAEYQDFLRSCSSIEAMDVWNGYTVHHVGLVLRILEAGETPSEREGKRLLPFGSDGGGNAFLIELSSGKVWKWRHDIHSAPFEEIAPSFTRFLNRMAEDWAHFIEGDSEWKYMAG